MLEQFRKFLIEKERVPEKNIPYYLKRISDCYRFFNLPDTSALENDQQAQSKGAENPAPKIYTIFSAILFNSQL